MAPASPTGFRPSSNRVNTRERNGCHAPLIGDKPVASKSNHASECDVTIGRRMCVYICACVSKSVYRIDAQLCCGPVETLERGHVCFECLYESTINVMPVLPIRSSMESPPTLEEIWEALSSVNSGKAAGKNGLLRT